MHSNLPRNFWWDGWQRLEVKGRLLGDEVNIVRVVFPITPIRLIIENLDGVSVVVLGVTVTNVTGFA